MTDQRELARDALAENWNQREQNLGRELLKALDERDAALRSIGEETKSYIEELEAERDKAEAERDRLREALREIIRYGEREAESFAVTGRIARAALRGNAMTVDEARAALEEEKS
jgi:hypothetical protein